MLFQRNWSKFMCVCVHAKLLQLCPTLCKPTDYSLPGSSVHGNPPDKNTGVGCHALLQGVFLTQILNLRLLYLLHWQAGSLPLVPPGKPVWITLKGHVCCRRIDMLHAWEDRFGYLMPSSPRSPVQICSPPPLLTTFWALWYALWTTGIQIPLAVPFVLCHKQRLYPKKTAGSQR